jgi:hypothetical protein
MCKITTETIASSTRTIGVGEDRYIADYDDDLRAEACRLARLKQALLDSFFQKTPLDFLGNSMDLG